MEDWLKVFIMGAVFLLVGIIFTQVLADNIYGINNYADRTDAIVWTNGTNTSLTYKYVTFTGIYNASGTALTSSNYTLYASNTQYVYMKNGTGCENGQTCYFRYRWQGNYVDDSASRTLINLINLFFALGVVAIAIWMFWDKIEDMF